MSLTLNPKSRITDPAPSALNAKPQTPIHKPKFPTQVAALIAKGIDAALLNSTLSQERTRHVHDRLLAAAHPSDSLRIGSGPTIKLLYVTPEALAAEGSGVCAALTMLAK